MDNFVDITGVESSYVGDPTRNSRIGALAGAAEGSSGTSDAGTGTGNAKQYFSAENIGAGLQVIGAIIPGLQKSEQEKIIKKACGRRPMIGRRRKEAYQECVSRLLTATSGSGGGRDMRQDDGAGNNTALLIGGVVIGLILIIVLVIYLSRNSESETK